MENPTAPPKFFFTARFDFSMHAYTYTHAVSRRHRQPQRVRLRRLVSPRRIGNWELVKLGIGFGNWLSSTVTDRQ